MDTCYQYHRGDLIFKYHVTEVYKERTFHESFMRYGRFPCEPTIGRPRVLSDTQPPCDEPLQDIDDLTKPDDFHETRAVSSEIRNDFHLMGLPWYIDVALPPPQGPLVALGCQVCERDSSQLGTPEPQPSHFTLFFIHSECQAKTLTLTCHVLHRLPMTARPLVTPPPHDNIAEVSPLCCVTSQRHQQSKTD